MLIEGRAVSAHAVIFASWAVPRLRSQQMTVITLRVVYW